MTTESNQKKPLSPWWRHAAILVMIAGFSVLSFITVLTYNNAPPIPEKVTDAAGNVITTQDEIERGQEVFFKYGLMEHGSLWGHGAYLGPDYSAEYLHRLAEINQDTIAVAEYGKPLADLATPERSAVLAASAAALKANRYNASTKTLVFTAGEIESLKIQTAEWNTYFTKKDAAPGLPENYIKNPDETRVLAHYFAWAAWASVANRPGKDYSYTNNWPYEPLVANTPSTEIYIWSALSLITLLGGLGLILFIFGKFDFLGWKGDKGASHDHQTPPQKLSLTPSQWATAWFFAIVSLLFLLQTALGGALAHYRVEPGAFYGIDIAQLLPYNLARTWHLQLAIFWIATAWVGGGLFLAPWVGGKEPKGQRTGVFVLLGALVFVVLGSLFGQYLGINDKLGKLWFWLGHQGSEYLDLGRFWQLLLAAGLVFWLFLMWRALRPAIENPAKKELSSLFLYAAAAIPVFYLPALFYGPRTNFAVIDNWRFWIIHLWVEGFFELFATVLVAIMFHQMGIVSSRTATRLVYLDGILYLGAGLIGTGHHWYFTGQGTLNMGLAACFSALEVVPLTLLTLDAWDFIRLRDQQCSTCGEGLGWKQKWAIYFLMAVGVWNFVGAGVFGFLINLPIVSYFEMGTTLTANHGHAAMFGVFGMLALAVVVFCMRAMQSDEVWKGTEKYVRVGFWGLNIGLALMVVLDLFPGGVLQLWDVIDNGYWHARRLTFLMSGLYHTLEWTRLGADLVFLLAGALPIAIGVVRAFMKRDLRPTE
ncbi:MAG: nitric-oxide reductase large subunit [Thermoanaerobaculia bacterium]|nr:nitric-oxide reductase large subunit [Thermoanaerobaculia bacterium]